MKPLLITLALGIIMAATAQADLYRIRNTNSLVTTHRGDLVAFMHLNATGDKPAIRALYNSLEVRGMLVNLQPGAVGEVIRFFGDGTAEIAGGTMADYYIATDDLTQYLYSQPAQALFEPNALMRNEILRCLVNTSDCQPGRLAVWLHYLGSVSGLMLSFKRREVPPHRDFGGRWIVPEKAETRLES
jgi:hypothetical protein